MSNHVSIILLNFNHAFDTIECLESLFSLSYNQYSIVTVDNGSKDDSVEIIKKWFQKRSLDEKKKFTLIENNENVGFSAGNNIGIKYAFVNLNPDYVWILNNDTVVEPNSLTALIKCSGGKNIWGSKLIYFDNKNKIQAYGGGYIHTFFGSTRSCTDINVHRDTLGEIILDYIDGASMFIPVSALYDVGLFDENYFLYCEDAELSKRFSLAGYHLKYCCDSIIYHKIGISTNTNDPNNKSEFFDIELVKNRFIYIRKYQKWTIPIAYIGLLATIVNRLKRKQFSRITKIIYASFCLKNPLAKPN